MQSTKKLLLASLLMSLILIVSCKEKAITPEEPLKLCPFKPKHPLDYRRIFCEGADGDTDITVCVQRCESNDPDATLYCNGAARFFRGEDEQEMRRLLTLSCEKGESLECISLADSFVEAVQNPQLPFDCERRGEPVPIKNYHQYLDIMRKYYPLIRNRCDEREDPMSCSIISRHYESGGWPPKYGSVCLDLPPLEPHEMFFQQDKAMALEYEKKACAYGAWGRCFELALTTKSDDEAVMYTACACENTDPGSKGKAFCEESVKRERAKR